jgi:hypothetical protein
MIRHVWTVLCSHSVRDVDSQNVSLFNVIEQVQATLKADAPDDAIHLLPIPLDLVTLWENGGWEADPSAAGDSARATVAIIDPAGQQLATGEVTADLVEHRRCRTVLRLGGFPVTVTGRYVVQVRLGDADVETPRLVAEVPVDVQVSREQSPQP